MKAVMFSYCCTLCSFLDWAPSVSHFSVGHCWWMFLNVLKLTVKFYNTLDVNLWGFSSCLHSFLAHSSLASFPCMDNQPLWWCQTDVRLHHQSSQLGFWGPADGNHIISHRISSVSGMRSEAASPLGDLNLVQVQASWRSQLLNKSSSVNLKMDFLPYQNGKGNTCGHE